MLDRLAYATRSMILAAVPSGARVLEAPTTLPRRNAGDSSVITFKAVRGPSLSRSERLDLDLPTSLLWTIANPEALDRVGVHLSGVRRWTDLDASPTAEAARDALQLVLEDAVIGPALLPGVAFAAVGTDSIRMTGAVGSMYGHEALGAGVTLTAETMQPCTAVTGKARAVLEVSAYAHGTAPVAKQLLADVEVALRGDDVDLIESETGCIFERHPVGNIVDLDGLAGAEWESRAVVRLAVYLRAMRATAIETIESVSFDQVRASTPAGITGGIATFEVTDT
ncbi:MAG: hypothetical protein VYA51_12750 [Planctomycetota bacterium]|nr:hypothetical protein [Planctomycetota bacterium]